MSNFGLNLRKIRMLKGISQQQLANQIGIKRASIGAYEENRTEPKIDNLIAIAKLFDVPTDLLLSEDTSQENLTSFVKSSLLGMDEISSKFNQIPCLEKKLEHQYFENIAKGSNVYNILPKIKIPIKSKFPMIAYKIHDLEMTMGNVGYFPNDIIFCELYDKDKLENLPANSLILAVMKNEIKLRFIECIDGEIILKAVHSRVEEIKIKKEAIIQVWRANYNLLNRQLTYYNNDLLDQLKRDLDYVNQFLNPSMKDKK